MSDFLRRIIAWFGAREPVVLFALLLISVAAWGFIATADEVLEGETQGFDVSVVKAMRQPGHPELPLGPRWLNEVGRDATALGGIGMLVFVTLAISGFLWLNRTYHMMTFLLVATISGLVASSLLKGAFLRPRPEVVPHLSHVYTTSFPSGHAMMSAVVYLTLGVLLASVVQRKRLKMYVLSIALLLTFLVGISRVYLGVHYPTDVLAGWSAGLAWALLCWLIARWLQRRGRIETDRETATENRNEQQ